MRNLEKYNFTEQELENLYLKGVLGMDFIANCYDAISKIEMKISYQDENTTQIFVYCDLSDKDELFRIDKCSLDKFKNCDYHIYTNSECIEFLFEENKFDSEIEKQLLTIQNRILELLRKEFKGEFSQISVYDIDNENTCIDIAFNIHNILNIESFTLERFYTICKIVNSENSNILTDIIQSFDLTNREIKFGYIVSYINE